MAPVRNGRLIFNEYLGAHLEPGKTTIYDETQTIDTDTIPLNGGILVKTIALSIDPFILGRMTMPPPLGFKLGTSIQNYGVGVVLRSAQSNVGVGQKVYGMFPFEEYFVLPSLDGFRIIDNAEGIPLTAYIGVAGMPGQTAYYGWKEYASPQKGDVVFVTVAAGPVGSLVIQLAKAAGLKVIASAGSAEKIEFVKSLGADVTFNYKTENTADVLAKEGPINIYWDNVGGETLDAALLHAARGARFIECGMISGFISAGKNPQPMYNLMSIILKEIKISGFVVSTLAPKYEKDFYTEIPKRIKSGEIKFSEELTKGLDKGGHVLLDALTGKNKAKSIIVVAEDEL